MEMEKIVNNTIQNQPLSANAIKETIIEHRTNILIVDDEAIIRTGLRKIFDDYRHINVIGEATSGEEAEKIASEMNPHVVLMDITMPGQGGVETTKRILLKNPSIKVLALSVHCDEHYPSKILSAGALGYITKGVQASEMAQAIEEVAKGNKYICAAIASKLQKRQLLGRDRMFDHLTKTEMNVCVEIVYGNSNEMICDKLNLTLNELDRIRSSILQKMDIENDVALIHLAIRNGLLDKDNFSSN